MRRWRWVIMMAALILVAGCGVTESGNPCPGGQCPEAGSQPDTPAAAQPYYQNDLYAVRIVYPDGWVLLSQTADSATFESGGVEPKSTATARFERLSPTPSSLLAYLQAQYPDRTFLNFSTPTLLGYYYDDAMVGPNGGDLHEYYFLDGNSLVTVEAEIIEQTRQEVMTLLDGISFI